MFFPPPDEESQNTIKTNNSIRNRKNRKSVNKRKIELFKKRSRLAVSMSTWAENFTSAATWQLKHQVAFWKAKAKALEYENQVLHKVIRQSHSNQTQCMKPAKKSEPEYDPETSPDELEDEDNENLEVSEEFIQFLTANAKYKEDARLERERLKAKYNDEEKIIQQLEAGPSKHEDVTIEFKKLYGSQWQRVVSLEMALQSDFMIYCDKEKPAYWPNIPFNFNFS